MGNDRNKNYRASHSPYYRGSSSRDRRPTSFEMDQQQRGRGRARGRARGTDTAGGSQQHDQRAFGGAQPRPGPSQQQAWGRQQQPVAQQPPQWGPRSQVQQQQQVRAPAPPQQAMHVGRASHRMEGVQPPGGEAVHCGQVAAVGDTLATHGRGGAMRGRRQQPEILITRPATAAVKQGTYGTRLQLSANYFHVQSAPDWTLYQYRVDFAPEEDRTGVKKRLVRDVTKNLLAGYLFDGTVLYTANRLNPDPVELFAETDSKERIRITIRLVGEVTKADSQRIQVFNILLRKCLACLKLQLVGRNYFDAVAKVSIPEHKLELWPGYVTTIKQHEDKILLCAEISSKVMRMDTVFNLLIDCSREDSRNYREIFQSRVIGCVVLTDYNNRTYHIDDVDWSSTPLSTFQKNNEAVSYVNYYRQRYNLHIRDTKQPMLISRAKAREIRMGMPETIYLVPELCRMTGLTDAQRQNFQLMRALADHTRVAPRARIDKLIRFCRRLNTQEQVMLELRQWNLSLAEKLIEFAGRALPPENIIGGRGASYSAGRDADWTRELRSQALFCPAEINSWVIITPNRCYKSAEQFAQLLNRASSGMKWGLPRPRLHDIRDDRPASYLEALEYVITSMKPSLIMCVVTNNKADRYSAIKKKCSIEKAVPTQVILAKNLDSKGAMSIATKVAIQLNCKLGGAPWGVQLPLSGLMVVGYDVCHDTSDKSKSFGATVASIDKNLTRYFNVCAAHKNGEELSNDFALSILKGVKAYQHTQGKIPDRIVIYRDGVGDGQLKYVFEHEVKLITEKLQSTYYPNGSLKLTFIVVSKKINTRLFANGENPPPGTVVDDCITLPERYDFYLVSQCVRQGTVSPTSYNILYDTSGLSCDHLQRLSYKLTHLYYNWSGTVRVPAPCQYAHKLAFLVGQSLHREPHQDLNTVLHYL